MRPTTVSAVVSTLLEEEEQWAENPSHIRGISTSFPSWDRHTGGLRPGEVTILAAYTSHGKTAIANQVAFTAIEQLVEAAEPDHKQVVIFSPEMSYSQLMVRYASLRSEVSSRRIETGQATAQERASWRAWLEYAKRFDQYASIFAGRSLDAADLLIAAEGKHQERPIALLVVDYLQRISGKGQTSYEQATYVSRHVKDIANGLTIPVLALSQVKRPENRKNPAPPTMFDLRDSGSLEQDADNVLTLFNPTQEEEHQFTDTSKATISIEKQRNGPTEKFHLYFRKSLTRFEDPIKDIRDVDF